MPLVANYIVILQGLSAVSTCLGFECLTRSPEERLRDTLCFHVYVGFSYMIIIISTVVDLIFFGISYYDEG